MRWIPPLRPFTLRSVLVWLLLAVVGVWLLAVSLLIVLRFVDPPTTALQTERRIESWFHDSSSGAAGGGDEPV